MSAASSSAPSADAKTFVAGHRGMVGSAICRELQRVGMKNLLTANRKQLDLCNQQQVADFFAAEQPEYVFLAAARVGGIHANNQHPEEFLRENLLIELNVIHQARRSGVKRLLFLGSSCIYPKFAPQPIAEEALLEGALEPTNEGYAIAKIAGIKMCEYCRRQYDVDFRSLMPCNLYGPGDNYDLQNSHVIPAMIRKFHDAKTQGLPFVEFWGTGGVYREFLHVDDLAAACVHVMNLPREQYESALEGKVAHLNVGAGREITIRALAEMIGEIIGYSGELRWNAEMPDGTPRKCVDTRRIESLGWRPAISLREGLQAAQQWYAEHSDTARRGDVVTQHA